MAPSKHPCGRCDFEAKTAGGLSSHVRSKHPATDDGPLAELGSNAAALEVTLQALDQLGRFERVDAAQIQQLRSLAWTVDVAPGNAQLWRQYLEALRDLLKADDDADSSFEQALEKIRGASPVGNATST